MRKLKNYKNVSLVMFAKDHYRISTGERTYCTCNTIIKALQFYNRKLVEVL